MERLPHELGYEADRTEQTLLRAADGAVVLDLPPRSAKSLYRQNLRALIILLLFGIAWVYAALTRRLTWRGDGLPLFLVLTFSATFGFQLIRKMRHITAFGAPPIRIVANDQGISIFDPVQYGDRSPDFVWENVDGLAIISVGRSLRLRPLIALRLSLKGGKKVGVGLPTRDADGLAREFASEFARMLPLHVGKLRRTPGTSSSHCLPSIFEVVAIALERRVALLVRQLELLIGER